MLHQPNFLGGKSKVPTHGEDHLCPDCCLSKVASILSGNSYFSNDESTNQKGNEQTKGSRANGVVGN